MRRVVAVAHTADARAVVFKACLRVIIIEVLSPQGCPEKCLGGSRPGLLHLSHHGGINASGRLQAVFAGDVNDRRRADSSSRFGHFTSKVGRQVTGDGWPGDAGGRASERLVTGRRFLEPAASGVWEG